MNTVTNYRACGILYNFLRSNSISGVALMPANICETVPATYMKACLDVEFFDISEIDFLADSKLMRARLASNDAITVLHYNHTFGYSDPHKECRLFKGLKDNFRNLVIIDDRCLCVPTFENNELLAAADMYLFSTGPVKYADIGYGSFAHINDKYDYGKFDLEYDEQSEAEFDRHIKYCHANKCHVNLDVMRGNWLKNKCINPDHYFGEVKECMNRIARHKSDINKIYKNIDMGRGMLPEEYSVWRYQLLVKNQSECLKAIFDNGLFASKHYMSLGNGYFKKTKTPNCDWLEAHVINLFNDFRVTAERAERTVEVLNKVINPIEVKL